MPISITSGGQNLQVLIRELDGFLRVTKGDMRAALTAQKKRILARTARGVDADGVSFIPYSQEGPYYWYPVSSRTLGATGQKRSIRRFAKKTGGTAAGKGIRFDSYAAFKRSLGGVTVNLKGPSIPHMLSAIAIRAISATRGVLSVVGPASIRAEGHNRGSGSLPRRTWFAAGANDVLEMVNEIADAMLDRLERRSRGRN